MPALCLTLPPLWPHLLGGAAKNGVVLLKHAVKLQRQPGDQRVLGDLTPGAFFLKAPNCYWYNLTVLCNLKGQKFAPEQWLG